MSYTDQELNYKQLLLDLNEILEGGDAKHDFEDTPYAFSTIHILSLIVTNALRGIENFEALYEMFDRIEEMKEHDEL